MKLSYTFRGNTFSDDRLPDFTDALMQSSDKLNPPPPQRSFAATLIVLRETESSSAGIATLVKYALQAASRLRSSGQPLRALQIAAAALPRLEDGSKNRLYSDTVTSLTASLMACEAIGGRTGLFAANEMNALRKALNPKPLTQVFPRMQLARSTLEQDMQKCREALGQTATVGFAQAQAGATGARTKRAPVSAAPRPGAK